MGANGLFSIFDRSAHLGRLFGVPIRVHVSLALFLLPAFRSRGIPLVYMLEFALGLILSILVHELGHALIAKRFGLRSLSITLHGFGGFASSSGARTPRQDLLIVLAGPAATFILGLALIFVGRSGMAEASLGSPAWKQAGLADILGRTNVLLGVLNLIPVLPWDGGQAVRAILAHRMPEFKAMRAAAHLGLVVAVPLFLYSLFFGGEYFGLFAFVGVLTCGATLLNSGGVRFGEFVADRKARKELEAVKRREEARSLAYLDGVRAREKEREEQERLRRIFEASDVGDP